MTEELIEKLWEVHNEIPEDGVCPSQDCDQCLKCTIFGIIKHIEEPNIFTKHPD